MCRNVFEEYDLAVANRASRSTKETLRQETRRQRREAVRRLDHYVRELLRSQPLTPANLSESPVRLD